MQISNFLRSTLDGEQPVSLNMIADLAELGSNQWQISFRVADPNGDKVLNRTILEVVPTVDKIAYNAKIYRFPGTAPDWLNANTPSLENSVNPLFPSVIFLGEYDLDGFLDEAGIARPGSPSVPVAKPTITNYSSSPMGTNLDSITYYNSLYVFRNLWKHSSNWRVPGQGNGVANGCTLDANGDITNFGVNASATSYVMGGGNGIAGTYVLEWDGHPTPIAGGYMNGVGVTLTNETPNRCQMVVTAGGSLAIQIRPVPNMGANYLRNFRLYRLGEDPSTLETQPWQKAFLNYVSEFSHIRFMDWMVTNNSIVSEWFQRRPKNYSRQVCDSADGNWEPGVAYEWIIDLCNLLGRDAWINVPHQATDEFVTNLATLFKDKLSDGLKLYVEYSNEVWNGQFNQGPYAQQRAGAEEIPNDPWGFKWYAKRARECWNLFKGVFGATANSRLKYVFASQAANPYVATEGLTYLNANPVAGQGIPPGLIVASAPYIDGTSPIPGGGRTQGGIPAGNVGQYNSTTSTWTNTGAFNPTTNTGNTTFNSVIPSSPTNGQRWYNNSNIMALSMAPGWAAHYNEKSVWENQIKALTPAQMMSALLYDSHTFRPEKMQAFKTAVLGVAGIGSPVFINYEQNQHLYSNVFTSQVDQDDLFVRFQNLILDPTFTTVINNYLDYILSINGHGGTWFSLSGAWTKFGYWGAIRVGTDSFAADPTQVYGTLKEWMVYNAITVA